MRITREPLAVQSEPPAALVAPEPEPAAPATPEPVESPEARAERQAADAAALSGTRALVEGLQARLSAVETEAAEHRQSAEQPFTGQPDELAGWLATTEQHRADASRLATEAEALQRQARVAEQLLGKLERERDDAESARTQAKGRVLLADAMKRYVEAAANLADVVVDLGAASIAANQSGSFAASVRALLLPDLPALGATLPALPGFRRQREGQVVATGDPAFSQRMNELMR